MRCSCADVDSGLSSQQNIQVPELNSCEQKKEAYVQYKNFSKAVKEFEEAKYKEWVFGAAHFVENMMKKNVLKVEFKKEPGMLCYANVKILYYSNRYFQYCHQLRTYVIIAMHINFVKIMYFFLCHSTIYLFFKQTIPMNMVRISINILCQHFIRTSVSFNQL